MAAALQKVDNDLEITQITSNDRAGRIRYADDVEHNPRGSTARVRSRSRDSMSIYSLPRLQTIEPGVALPIQYRTLSFNIEESKALDEKAEKPKDKTLSDHIDLDWHKIPVDEVFRRLSTSPKQGLSHEQFQRRLKEHGLNTFTPPPNRWGIKIITYLFGGFGSIVLIASVLVFVAWKPLGNPPAIANLALAIVLAIVFFIQAAFNFWQDFSTSRVMSSVKNMLPEQCIVLRDGEQQHIPGTEIVPGDILRIKLGDKLPADVRFIEVSPDAKFDRSILNGESLPVRATLSSDEENYLETTCIGMAGTHCISGDSYGVVVATGDRSVFGQLAKLTSQPKTGLTSLEREIYYFVAVIAAIMISMILLVIIVWATWLRKAHPDWINLPLLIVDCVSVAVAFIPEGLPIAVTSSLTIVANIMRRNNILCKSLKTVETLGCVSVICSDKTGTLTTNKMTVTQCLVGRIETFTAEATLQNDTLSKADNGIRELATIGGLCNAGEFDPTDSKTALAQRKIMGDATDQAVLRFSQSLLDVKQIREQNRTIHKVPFNSKTKFMINVLCSSGVEKNEPSQGMLLTIKGAPDILLPRCTEYTNANGDVLSMSEEDRAFIEQTKDTWSRKAKRVILIAKKTIKSDTAKPLGSVEFEDSVLDEASSGLTLVGLVGIVDPPRPEIPEVVSILRGAGIRIFMVTGDAQLTAQAIATECGIITQDSVNVDGTPDLYHFPNESTNAQTDGTIEKAIVINGPDMKDLDTEAWDRLCRYREVVFARTTPEQKLKIVKELQARDEVVGMTGDGVNDAPSLKAADIGIAMGSGSDIAIEAADMVLLDSFAAIVEAVKYGRVVFDNLKKTICYLLPAGSFSEFWPVITNVFFGLPQILSSFLMIIICCFTDCAAAIAIAYEKPEADVLRQRPRNLKKDHLVDWKLILHAYFFVGILETVSSFAMSYWYAARHGVPFSSQWFGFGKTPDGLDSATYTSVLNTASSIYFVNLVVMQWFVLMATRTRRLSIFQQPPLFNKSTRNWYLFPAIIFALLTAIFFLYVPAFQQKLSTAVVPVQFWFLPWAFGMGILLLDEGRKCIVMKYPKCILAKTAW